MKNLFTSRKFWALLIGLIVLVLGEFIPQFHLDEEAAIGLVIVIASYILGVAVDPGPGGWKGVVQSRKFWAACVGLLIVVMDGFGLKLPAEVTPDVLIWALVTIGAYIGGVSLSGPAPVWMFSGGEKDDTDQPL